MPWKQLPPDWIAAKLDQLLFFLGVLIAVTIGMVAKVAAEVRDGHRDKMLSKRWLLDMPSLLMMVIVAYGIASYYELPAPAAGSLGAVLGHAGPRIIYLGLHAALDRVRGVR